MSEGYREDYRVTRKTCDQHVEDMVELAKPDFEGFSTPGYAAGVLAELIVREGQHRHAVALGGIVLAVRALDKMFDLLCTSGFSNEEMGRTLYEKRDEIGKLLGRP